MRTVYSLNINARTTKLNNHVTETFLRMTFNTLENKHLNEEFLPIEHQLPINFYNVGYKQNGSHNDAVINGSKKIFSSVFSSLNEHIKWHPSLPDFS